MAVVAGTVKSVHGYTTDSGELRDSSNNRVFNCKIGVEFSGTYAQADNAQISDVDASIESNVRSGGAITLLDAAFSQPGLESQTIIGAKTVAVSGNNITLELTGADLSTEHANAALSTMTRPMFFFVSYKIDK